MKKPIPVPAYGIIRSKFDWRIPILYISINNRSSESKTMFGK